MGGRIKNPIYKLYYTFHIKFINYLVYFKLQTSNCITFKLIKLKIQNIKLIYTKIYQLTRC